MIFVLHCFSLNFYVAKNVKLKQNLKKRKYLSVSGNNESKFYKFIINLL